MSFQIDCPRCGGSPDFDEHGFPYTCFSCGDTGYVWIEETYAGRKTRELNEAYEEYAGVSK